MEKRQQNGSADVESKSLGQTAGTPGTPHQPDAGIAEPKGFPPFELSHFLPTYGAALGEFSGLSQRKLQIESVPPLFLDIES
jgi:hypothetical protein